MVKNQPAKAGDVGSLPGSGRSPWRREWQPTPVFLPGEPHGQRSLVGYSPWGHKDRTSTKHHQQMLYSKHCLETLSYFISALFIEHRLCIRLEDSRKEVSGAFLVVQWLRLCILNAGAPVPSLVRKLNPTCND